MLSNALKKGSGTFSGLGAKVFADRKGSRVLFHQGFTLVEMLVAMALTVFVMVILSECFVQGLETFSGLKSIGDLQEQLRTATTVLRADLSADHFEGRRRLSDPANSFIDPANTGKIREGFFVVGQGYPPKNNPLNNPSLSTIFPTGTNLAVGNIPSNPNQPSGYYEGADPKDTPPLSKPVQPINNIYSMRAIDHWLHFSVKLRGNAREKVFTASGPGNVATSYLQQNNPQLGGDAVFLTSNQAVNSPWAEIAYFLLPTGTTLSPSVPGGPGIPLFALYRCQYLVLPETADANNPPGLALVPDPANPNNNCAPYGNFSGNPAGAKMQFYSPNDLANGYTTRAFNPYAYFSDPSSPFRSNIPPRGFVQSGASVLLGNVISFQVQVFKSPHSMVTRGPANAPLIYANPSFPDFEDVNLSVGGVYIPFDTANYVKGPPLPAPYFGSALQPPVPVITPPSQSVPAAPFSIQALRIVLRIWDTKTHVTRQVTIIQDM